MTALQRGGTYPVWLKHRSISGFSPCCAVHWLCGYFCGKGQWEDGSNRRHAAFWVVTFYYGGLGVWLDDSTAVIFHSEKARWRRRFDRKGVGNIHTCTHSPLCALDSNDGWTNDECTSIIRIKLNDSQPKNHYKRLQEKKNGLILTHDGKWRRLCYTRLLTIWFQFSLKDFLTKKRKEFCLELKYLRSQQPASKTTCIYCLLSLKDILGCSPTGRQWISVRLKWD